MKRLAKTISWNGLTLTRAVKNSSGKSYGYTAWAIQKEDKVIFVEKRGKKFYASYEICGEVRLTLVSDRGPTQALDLLNAELNVPF